MFQPYRTFETAGGYGENVCDDCKPAGLTTVHMESRGNDKGETIGWGYEPCGVGCCMSTSLDWPCISYTRGRELRADPPHGWMGIWGTARESREGADKLTYLPFVASLWDVAAHYLPRHGHLQLQLVHWGRVRLVLMAVLRHPQVRVSDLYQAWRCWSVEAVRWMAQLNVA